MNDTSARSGVCCGWRLRRDQVLPMAAKVLAITLLGLVPWPDLVGVRPSVAADGSPALLSPAQMMYGVRPGPQHQAAPLRRSRVMGTESASDPSQIEGIVTSPVVGKYAPGNPTSFAFTIAGSVNASPDEWFMAVDALNPADADPGNEANWVYNVATFDANGGGPDVFTFSASVVPFAALPNSWKPGGLGRLRVVVAMDADPNQWAILPVRDDTGQTPANPFAIVVADNAPNPTKPPGQTDASIKNPFNTATPNYLSVNSGVLSFPPGQLAQQEAAAQAYYSQVKINKDGTGTSIWQSLPTLKAFIDHYFRPFECSSLLNEPQRITKYFNKGDLGIGREMHCINRGCTGELACYVRNFGAANGTAVFNDKAKAKEALLANRPFATVAMVERQGMAQAAANRVFFVVYEYTAANGLATSTKLALKAQLDNKGYNTSIPGNCLQCHGINATYTAHTAHQVKNAMFLPFDLNAFDYFSTDPTSALSRVKQESAFRAHNRMVRSFSSLFFSAEARNTIGGWYNGDMFAGTFNGNFVPSGWQGDVNQEALYRKLNAVACRTCHISYLPFGSDNRPFLKFGTFADFALVKSVVKADMCGATHRMPAAEQTLKVLWQSSGRAHYFAQMPGEFGDCGL